MLLAVGLALSLLAHSKEAQAFIDDVDPIYFHVGLENVAKLKMEYILFKLLSGSGEDEDDYALYSYDGGPGTSNWPKRCSSGSLQSPINFVPWKTTPATKAPLKLSGAREKPSYVNVSNVGNTVQITFHTSQPITVTGGVFGDKVYEFQQMHYHWGQTGLDGSEHTISSAKFPLESHMVFYNERQNYEKGAEPEIAVLGILYELDIKNNEVIDDVVQSIWKIVEPGQFTLRQGARPLADYLPPNLNTYFSYRGSLTTPPCTENVSWVVFTVKNTISEYQLSHFKQVKDSLGHRVEFNHREQKPSNEREVLLVRSTRRGKIHRTQRMKRSVPDP